MRFGQTVGHIRKTKSRYSQESLAHAVNVHRTYMGLIERGKANATLDIIERIAQVLEVTPARLLSDSD
jgi:transcriptional regulator with XRE-family HTH domain